MWGTLPKGPAFTSCALARLVYPCHGAAYEQEWVTAQSYWLCLWWGNSGKAADCLGRELRFLLVSLLTASHDSASRRPEVPGLR